MGILKWATYDGELKKDWIEDLDAEAMVQLFGSFSVCVIGDAGVENPTDWIEAATFELQNWSAYTGLIATAEQL